MNNTQRGMRLHIGVFGRRNVGKSSIINSLTGQELSIVSDIAGTTTDVVQKSMEMLPLGPVLFLDTAGIDDEGALGEKRIEKTKQAYERTDLALIVCDYNGFGNFEKELFEEFAKRKTPSVVVINKNDIKNIQPEKLEEIRNYTANVISVSANDQASINELKKKIIDSVPQEYLDNPQIVSDFLNEGDICLLVTPIDKEAPRGRLILPQVQTIRDVLDKNAICLVVKETELNKSFDILKIRPKLVVTDSQAFKTVSEIVPHDVLLTSFSIAFARLKGDLKSFAQGANAIDSLQNGDRILISESCTHHQIEDDIARVKIPNLLRKYTQKELIFEYSRGHDFPENLSDYKLIIHCGACMTNRREVLSRIMKAYDSGVPITNYGITIAKCLGILDRAMKPFSINEKRTS